MILSPGRNRLGSRQVSTLESARQNDSVAVVFCFPLLRPERHMQESALLAAIQKEIHRHELSYFVDEPPSVAQGGRGVVVSGCPACRKRINTMTQFLDHPRSGTGPSV